MNGKRHWTQPEITCLVKARQESIQLKIIAMFFDRTVPAVSKMIKRLGLNPDHNPRGRPKGNGKGDNLAERVQSDFSKMQKIVKKHYVELFETPPKIVFMTSMKYKNIQNLKDRAGQWVSDESTLDHQKFRKSEVESWNIFSQLNRSYDHEFQYNQIIRIDERDKKLSQKSTGISEHIWISWPFLEFWLEKIGNHIQKISTRFDYDYAFNSAYATRVQLLIFVNEQRLSKKLRPFYIPSEKEI